MKAYAINLDGETQRWERLVARFAPLGLEPERVPGVDGRKLDLPVDGFAHAAYERFHGRRIAMGKIGVFQSQIRMITRFHESDPAETGEVALFLEDDVRPEPDLPEVLEHAVRLREHWDVLRLSGLSEAKPLRIAKLNDRYHLALTCDRLKGAGGYLMNRRAAAAFAERVPPQWLPWDHHIDPRVVVRSQSRPGASVPDRSDRPRHGELHQRRQALPPAEAARVAAVGDDLPLPDLQRLRPLGR